MNLSSTKVTRKGDIPAKILKDSLSVYTKELTTIINNCLKDGLFPNELKLADVSPIFTKDVLNKENYRPVSILSHMSKVFETIFYKQIDRFMTLKFSPFLFGFRKNHNSKYSLLKIIEVWKKNLDKRNEIVVILTDLSKAFDTINHSLLLTKLEAYGFSMTSLKLMQNYLCNQFQRTSVNASFSDWKEIETGVLQGSVLRPLLFNIFLNDIFYFINNGNLCNYADDNILYSIGKSLNMVKENLKINFLIMREWFYENHMVLNPWKCHYLVLGNRSNSDAISLNGSKLASSSYEKLLGILSDRDVSFDKHIKSLCRKTDQKLNALARISNYLTHDQKRFLLNSIIKFQFSYCPLIWMFCSRSLNNLINRIHKRALRLIHNDHVSTFLDILEITKEKGIHLNNLESLITKEICKFLNGVSPSKELVMACKEFSVSVLYK